MKIGPRPELRRDDPVIVTEQGIAPWAGIVRGVKPSNVSGWWVDIERDDGVWAICLKTTTVERVP